MLRRDATRPVSGLSYSVNDADFGKALAGIARETGKGVQAALRAQARRLGIELAGLALPNAGAQWGKNGLKSRARKLMEKRIFKDLNKIHRSAGDLSLREAVVLDNPVALNILARDLLGRWRREENRQRRNLEFFNGKSSEKRPVSLADVERQAIQLLQEGRSVEVRSSRVKRGGELVKEEFGSIVFRIMRAALRDPAKALVSLGRFIKRDGDGGNIGGTQFASMAGGQVLQGMIPVKGVGGRPYREQLASAAKEKKFKQLIVLDTRRDTRSLIQSVGKSLISRIGKVKGGWIDAAFRIPKPSGAAEPQIDAWISGKRANGKATEFNASNPLNLSFAITLENFIGNAGDIDRRLNYSRRAIRNRTAAMRKEIEAAMKRRLGGRRGASQFRAIYSD